MKPWARCAQSRSSARRAPERTAPVGYRCAGVTKTAPNLQPAQGLHLDTFFDTEIAAPAGKTGRKSGDSRLDLPHEPSQPVVGSVPHSRGAGQAGHRCGAIDGGEVSASAPKATFPDLANIPNESCRADSLDRLFHRANRDVPSSVCLRRAVTCSTQGAALRGDGNSASRRPSSSLHSEGCLKEATLERFS